MLVEEMRVGLALVFPTERDLAGPGARRRQCRARACRMGSRVHEWTTLASALRRLVTRGVSEKLHPQRKFSL